jgi:gas vesicle protein
MTLPPATFKMTNQIYLLIGAIISAAVGLLAARLTSGIQLKIARSNSKKDLLLQQQRLADERQRAEAALERAKLETLHKILSTISFETSQTMSYIQSKDIELSVFRRRYIDNCNRLDDALAIADLYYPDMSSAVRKIYGQTNIFWGSQEALIRTDVKTNQDAWQAHLHEVLGAGNAIRAQVETLHSRITARGTEIRSDLARFE